MRIKVANLILDARLVFLMHHALYDAIAMDRLQQVYKDVSLPRAPNMEPFLQSMILESSGAGSDHWRQMLAGFRPKYLAAASGKHTSTSTLTSRFELDLGLKSIEERCRAHSVTLLSACQASWAQVLMQSLNTNDVCFGNVVSGRTVLNEDVEDLVAPCLNTLPVRAKAPPQTTNLQLMNQLQNVSASSLPYQLYSLRRIQAESSPDNSRLFDSLLLLQQTPQLLDGAIWTLEADYGQIDVSFVACGGYTCAY